jgi:hypothetical protein
VLVLCTALLVVVNVLFRNLDQVERGLRIVARRYARHPSGNVTIKTTYTNDQNETEDVEFEEANFHQFADRSGTFVEFQRLKRALIRLLRELQMLRAFVPIASDSFLSTRDGDPRQSGASAITADDEIFVDEALSVIAPYTLGTLWSVPVSTLIVDIAKFQMQRGEDPVALHHVHLQILELVQCHVGRFSGGSLDSFFGDRFILHFNAAGRTVGQALAALDVGLSVVADVASSAAAPSATLHFGVASAPALCGFLGPSRLKVFTVVSDSVAQAAMMSRIASKERKAPGFVTWRAAEVAKQQMASLSSRIGEVNRFLLIQRLVLQATSYLVVLPGEPETSLSVIFAAGVMIPPSLSGASVEPSLL